jgi:hypothetical protein
MESTGMGCIKNFSNTKLFLAWTKSKERGHVPSTSQDGRGLLHMDQKKSFFSFLNFCCSCYMSWRKSHIIGYPASAPPPSPSFVATLFVNLRVWRPFFDSLVAFGAVHTQSGLIPGGVDGSCCRSRCDGGEQGLHCVPLYLSRVLNVYYQEVFVIFLSFRVLFC